MYTFLKRRRNEAFPATLRNSCSHQGTVKWLMMQWRIVKEWYCQAHSELEPTNQNLNRRLQNLALRDDGIADLKGPNGYKQGQWEALIPNMNDYLMNHVHFCHNLYQVEWNDCTVYCTNSMLLQWKALIKWRPNDTNTQLIIWHIISILPFFFCMSGLAEQSACDSTWMLFDWSCTGSTEWLMQLFCDYRAQLGGSGVKVHLMSLKQIQSMTCTWNLH